MIDYSNFITVFVHKNFLPGMDFKLNIEIGGGGFLIFVFYLCFFVAGLTANLVI